MNLVKRAILSVLSVILIFSGINYVKAEEAGNEKESDVFGLYAVWFIANDMYNNPESKWDEKTRISNIVEIRDLEGLSLGYTFELKNKNNNNGYVFVRQNEDELDIAEFSYEEKPLYLVPEINGSISDVYMDGIGEYFILTKGKKLYNLNGEIVEEKIIKDHSNKDRKALNPSINNQLKSLGKSISEWTVGYAGQISGASGTNAGITDPYKYVNDRYGTGWSQSTNKVLSVTAYLQSYFESGANNCTISSITQAFNYFRGTHSKIPSSISTIYSDVKTIATKHGYTKSGGTPPTKINNIITDVWKKFGYSTGSANTDYVISFSTIVSEIKNNRPVIFNNANGYYSNHSFLIKGYRTYVKGSSTKNFIRLNDNWSTGERWMDYSAWNCCGSIVKFVKP